LIDNRVFVVYLDANDQKLILERDASSPGGYRRRALDESGIAPERRFTFYDQVLFIIVLFL
jgi:hypothetical protein